MKAPLSLIRKIITEVLAESGPEYTERDEAISIYSDVYKEKNGIRPRFMDWDKYSTEEIQAMLEKLYDEPSYNDDFDSPYDRAPEPHELDFYPDNEGTVTDEPAVASVRSGGPVRHPASPDDEPKIRINKTWKRADGNTRDVPKGMGRGTLAKSQR